MKTVEKVKRVERAILFTNYSSNDFTHFWDSVRYDFPQGQSMMLESGLAIHFAKHLAVRELNIKDKNTGGGALQKEMSKALSSTEVKAEDKTKLKQEVMNENIKLSKKEVVKEAEDKGMKVDKRKSAEVIKKELNEFEGLKKE